MPEPIQYSSGDPSPSAESAPVRRSYPFLSEIKESGYRYGPVTVGLIAVCVVVALYSSLGNDEKSLLPLFISLTPASGPYGVLPEVKSGEVWRLLTPMFIHFGVLHIVFNMIWLKDIGSAIEHRDGSKLFVAMVVVTALCSNIGQYLWSGPAFGGMSGVVYGLFGYVAVRSLLAPRSGYYMPGQTVLIMLAWFVACLLGVIPHVANAAHGYGLLVGVIWGFIAVKIRSERSGEMTIVRS